MAIHRLLQEPVTVKMQAGFGQASLRYLTSDREDVAISHSHYSSLKKGAEEDSLKPAHIHRCKGQRLSSYTGIQDALCSFSSQASRILYAASATLSSRKQQEK